MSYLIFLFFHLFKSFKRSKCTIIFQIENFWNFSIPKFSEFFKLEVYEIFQIRE